MKYQLVLQFPALSAEDFDRLVALEEKLSEALASEHDVDGHDFGSGEMNLFIHTNDPQTAFEKVKRILLSEGSAKLTAAFREMNGSTYIVLWPEGAKEFKVV